MDFLPVKQDGSGIARMNPGNHLDQRRFPGTIFTQKRVNFTGSQIEIDILQGFDAGKKLSRPAY